jgi:hypothetical protein
MPPSPVWAVASIGKTGSPLIKVENSNWRALGSSTGSFWVLPLVRHSEPILRFG